MRLESTLNYIIWNVGAHALLAMLLESQSNPSYRPSPLVAHVLWMYLQEATKKIPYYNSKKHINRQELQCFNILQEPTYTFSNQNCSYDDLVVKRR